MFKHYSPIGCKQCEYLRHADGAWRCINDNGHIWPSNLYEFGKVILYNYDPRPNPTKPPEWCPLNNLMRKKNEEKYKVYLNMEYKK